jgi:hypothetical protein
VRISCVGSFLRFFIGYAAAEHFIQMKTDYDFQLAKCSIHAELVYNGLALRLRYRGAFNEKNIERAPSEEHEGIKGISGHPFFQKGT